MNKKYFLECFVTPEMSQLVIDTLIQKSRFHPVNFRAQLGAFPHRVWYKVNGKAQISGIRFYDLTDERNQN